ncbi:MAG TPA: hypothetical protein VHM70_26115 [Polyangiaceae bacterium]|nr:hypothetical protein [Polyangiaceae bacterium]
MSPLVSLSATLVAFWAFAPSAQAKEVMLDAAPFESGKVRLDGLPKEWPALAALSEQISGKSGTDPSANGLVGYDADNLYVAMRITDAKLVRTSAMGKNEDHATLKLAFPLAQGGHRNYQVDLYPGVPGKSAGAVRVGGSTVSDAKLVEAPMEGGLTFEAQIPWSTFAEAKRIRNGLKGALLYVDVDSGAQVSAIIGTSKKSEGSLPLLTTEAEYGLNDALVFEKNLNPRPARELFANLVGNEMLERVAVYDRYLAITGWGYREGKEFFYQDLNIGSPSNLLMLDAADFDADGHDELVIQRRIASEGGERDYVEVWRFDSDTAPPKAVFQHEVGISQAEARITNSVSIGHAKGKATLTVSQGANSKVDPETWTAAQAGEETLPTLLPWEAVKSRTYAWSGDHFAMSEEKPGTPSMKPPKRGTRFYSGTRPPSSAGHAATGGEDPIPGAAAPPPAPRAPTAEELLDQVYTLYRTERGLKRTKPSFDFVTDVAGDDTTERVLVNGSDLVVFGRHFKEGTSYVYTTIGVKEPKDILDVTARDLTGDGHADIVVRAVLHAQASKQMGGKVVTRHALFVYRVSEQGISRIFAAETGRSLEDNLVLQMVRFVPSGHGLDIELLPGRAVGWTEQTYPFPEDKSPYGGLQTLALPWSGSAPRRYVYRGSEFTLQ